METAIVRQFLDLFQDFINLCQLENWPENNTSETEIKNAFLMSKHVEKCLDKLQKKNIISEFLSALNSIEETPSVLLKKCVADPPQYILKKIINSNAKISQMDVGFKVFSELFSEEKLEDCLSVLMVEAASKETLLKHLSTEIPKENLLEFKSQVFLTELSAGGNVKDTLADILNNANKNLIEILVFSLSNKELIYHEAVNNVVNAFTNKMSNKMHTDKHFWKLLLNVEEKYLIQMCCQHCDLFKLISKALIDCNKLLQEQMSTEYFYLDLTYSALINVVRKLYKNECLRLEFFDIVSECSSDLHFWKNLIN